MLADFNLLSAVIGSLFGAAVGLLVGRSGRTDLVDLLDELTQAYERASDLYARERRLNEGLTQELAAQAKIVK